MALCAISGVVPQEPVVSTKSGHVFEKRLVEKHIELTGQCPVTNQELALSNLIPLQVSKVAKPRPPSATSIPGIIQVMQNEWDALMLETYSLKKHLEDVRQELAHSLYQHDAACRVIARLIKERDMARAALGDTQSNMAAATAAAGGAVNQKTAESAAASGSAAGAMADDASAGGITSAISKAMEATEQALSKNRKKNVKAAAGRVPAKDKFASFTALGSFTPHSSSKPGLTAVDVSAANNDLIVTGGVDTNAVLFNHKTGKIVDTLKGHSKPLTAVKFSPDASSRLIFTAAQDSAIVWKTGGDGKYAPALNLSQHKAAINSLTVHPSGSFFITGSADSTWNFYDVTTGSVRVSYADEKIPSGYTRTVFHPDGLILGTGGADSVVRIFDVRTRQVAATLKGHTGGISDLVFSENGVYVASADAKGIVKLWDLRGNISNLCTLSPADAALKGTAAVHSLDFDASGTYLAVGTDKDVRVFHTSKTLELAHTFADHTASVTGVRWGVDAALLASVSMDRSLRVTALPK